MVKRGENVARDDGVNEKNQTKSAVARRNMSIFILHLLPLPPTSLTPFPARWPGSRLSQRVKHRS